MISQDSSGAALWLAPEALLLMYAAAYWAAECSTIDFARLRRSRAGA